MNSPSTNKILELAETIPDIYSIKRKRHRIIFDDDFQPKKIFISSSLLKKMFFRGEGRDFCPHKLYHTDIIFDYIEPPTLSMLNGLYFESRVLGETASGKPMLQLPTKLNGQKTIDQIRIDEQVFNAKNVIKAHGMIVEKQGALKNIQVYKSITFPGYQKEGVEVFLEMTMDLVTPLELAGVSYSGVIVDLKLTKSLQTEHGEFCWARPHLMDHIQAYIYSFYIDLPFFYLIFDYPTKDMSHRFVPVNTNVNHPDREKAGEARMRFQETHELIRKSIEMLIEFSKHGWYTNPNYDNCKTCPLLYCNDRGKNQEI